MPNVKLSNEKADYERLGINPDKIDGIKTVSGSAKLLAKIIGLNLSYTRYLAYGELILTDADGEIKRSGELIYEFI